MYMQEYKRWMEAELEDFDLKAGNFRALKETKVPLRTVLPSL